MLMGDRGGEKPAWPEGEHPVDVGKVAGAGEGIRTLDPNLGKVVLYP
jgi:hypothetical protein